MTHLQRFKKFLKFKKISTKEAPKRLNVPNLQVTRYLTEVTKSPNIDFVSGVLAQFEDLNPMWWLCGKGGMIIAGQKVPSDSIIIKKSEYEALQNEVSKLQRKLLDNDETLKKIAVLEAWKEDTEKEVDQLNDNIIKLTKIIGKITEDIREMKE